MTSHAGLSVGATTLAAVSPTRARTARPVLTRAGQPLGGFVDRVGDPVGIVAADGSVHSAATLLAQALRDLALATTAGAALPESVAVAYPGHWKPGQVEALRRALRRTPPWTAATANLTLLPDYTAAMIALRGDLPGRGVAVVCDFGGTATTIALVDLDTARPIGTPLRCTAFCGDAIDREVLTHVLAAVVRPGDTGTSALAALTRLRDQCRAAKERLSSHTVTEVPGPLGAVRLARPELEDIIRGLLSAVPAALQELLQHNGITIADLAAVVSVGGGAAIPAVTAALSRHTRLPVVTPARPASAAATGAALAAAAAGRPREAETVLLPSGHRPAALAWSEAGVPEFVPLRAARAARAAPRPRVEFMPAARPTGRPAIPRHRRPLVVAAAVLAVIAGAGGATALALRHGDQSPRTVVAVPAPPGSG